MPPTLPEGITRDRKPSGLPEGITRDNKPVSIYPSAEEMFSTTNEILTRLPALDKENRALFETGRKKLDASIYLSEKSGRPVDEIVNNYEMMSVAHKYSGNHEADWEKMLGQIQHKNQIKKQQLEALKEATGLDKAKNAMGAFVGGMTSVPAATVDWVAISAYQLQQNFPDFFERANNFLGKENTSSPDDLATAQFAKWMVNKAEEIAPTNPALKGQFWSDTVPNAAGSMTTFLIGGGLVKKILKSTVTPVLAMGMTGQGSSGYRDAIANGATERQALYSFLLNTGAGASEVVPISRMLNRIGAPGKKKAITYLRNAGIEGLGEFIQESIVSGTSNVIAQQIYDADRKFWDGVLESGAAGGVTGVLASFLVSALPGKQNISMKNTGAGKVNESIPNEEGWALAREHMSDAQLEDKFGPNGVFAANGDKEAQKAFEESLIPDVEAMNAKAEEEAFSQPPEAIAEENVEKAPPVKVEELKQPLLNEDQLAQVEELILESETVAVEKDVQARVDDKPMTSAESQLLELEIQEEIDGLGRKEKADATKLARITKLEDRLYAIKKGSALDKKQALMDLRAEKNQQLKTQREKAGVKFANEVNKRLTLVKRHFKQKKDLRESMGLLIDIVKLMPRPIRGDLLGQIRSLSTKVSPESQIRVLDTAVEMASAKVDRFLAIESRNNLRKITKPLIKEIKAARAGQKKPNKELQSLYDYLSERGLIKNDTRDIIQIKNKELQARIEDAENKGNEYSLSEEDQLLMIQALSPDLNRNDLTYNEYKAAIADIETLKKEGLTVRQKKLHEEKIKVNAKIALIASEIDQRLDIKGKKELSPSEVKEFQGKMAQLSAGKFAFIDYRSVSKLLTGLKNGGKIKKFIFDKISKGMSESIISHEQYIQFINRLENQYSIDVKNLSSTDLIRIGNRSMSVHEAMFVYGHSQNRHGQRHLANTEFGGIRLKERVVDDIVSSLSSNHKQFVDELISYNDAVMYPKLNKMFQRLYGLDMPKVLRYLPLSNLNHGNAFDSILGEAFTIATTADSFLKERTASKASFTSLDLIGTLYRHNQAAEHTLAMKEIIQTTQSILRNKPLQNKINSIDKKANAWIKDYLQDVARGQMSPPNSEAIAILRLLRNNVRTFFIALNPGSWLKTQTPIISAMQDIDKGAMLSTLMRPWNGYSNWETAKTKSKFMASRKNTARIEILEIAQLKDHYSRRTSKGIKKLGAKAALFNTRMQKSAYWIYSPLDLASTSAVWVSKYRSELSKDGNEDRAIQAADEVVKVHFPSGRVEELAALFRSGGLEKELTVFTSDMNRMFNLGYSKSQLNERKIQEAIAYAVYSLLLSSIFLAATDFAWDRLREAFGIKKPEDNKKEKVLQDAARYLASQSLGGIPLVGTGAEGAMAKLTGDAMMSEMIMRQTPIYAYPLVQIGRGNYVSAASSAVGIPGANLLSPMIDDYLKDEDYYELERPQDND